MTDALQTHIKRFISVSDIDLNDVVSFFKTSEYKKKQNLLAEGEICRYSYFVTKGILRMFFVNEKGVEQTIQFALENWWIADYYSFDNRTPSDFHIQAVENVEVLIIERNSLENMLQKHPQMERYFRQIHQRAHAASQFRIKSLYDLSREELYHQFIERFPEFVQRIPQYLLASYLGFTPEYLSEIRNRRIS